MKIAVTGATGHVGANLVRALLARGDSVRCLVHNRADALDGLDVERVQGDTRDLAALERLVQGAELVFHLAARISIVKTDAPEVEATNVQGTRNVLAACKSAGVRRLVHFSSIHALAVQPHKEATFETRPLVSDLISPHYDRSKATAHGAVLQAAADGLDVVIVQPTAILGGIDLGPSAMGQVLINLYRGDVPALVNGGFDWVDVRDVVAGAIAASEKGRKGEAYLLGGAWASLPKLAAEAAKVTGKPAPKMVCPMWLARASAPFAEMWARLVGRDPLFTGIALHALRIHPDVRHDKAARELGYNPRSLHDTLRDAYQWFRENDKL